MSLSRIAMPLLSAHGNQAPWAQNMDRPRAVSVKTAIEKLIEKGHSVDYEEVHHILQQQFPELRELVTQWFPNKTFPQPQTGVGFGKEELPLSEVHYMKKLMTLGDSVCRLLIGNNMTATGFVLFQNMILTNAHLFNKNMFVNGSDGQLSVSVVAQFNYEDPTLTQLPECFEVSFIFDIDYEMDYAFLWLKAKPGQSVPPGLLKHFGPCPESGDLCIIGHHGGDVKKIDLTSVIEKEKRKESVDQKLEPYNKYDKILLWKQLDDQHIDQIYIKDDVITYDTFMFHGSSGSPLFDAQGRVVGLHSSGFVYGLNGPHDKSAIEFAHPVLDIFKKLLKRFYSSSFKEEARGNQYVESILAGY